VAAAEEAKVYARRFTAAIGRLKMEEAALPLDAVVTCRAPARVWSRPGRSRCSSCRSHSIPECAALIIDTPAGRVDPFRRFQDRPQPVVGEPWDDALWQMRGGEAPVKALTCDSTNVFVPHPGRSEACWPNRWPS
jgi:ribonuclease J